MLKLALKRIKMNNNIIALLGNIHNNRQNSIQTEFGPTDTYQVGDGLDQGEVNAPILWHIFYDPLLCEIDKYKSNLGYNINNHNISYPHHIQQRTSISITNLVFVDDTIWISNNQDNMQKILRIA